MQRRDVLRSLAGAVALPALGFGLPAADAAASPGRLDRIGIQLYTVRDPLSRDFEGTLARLGDMGFDEVEFAGYFDRSPAAVLAALERAGLAAPAAHVGFDAILPDRRDRTLDVAAAVGHRWIVCPWIPAAARTPDGYRDVARLFNETGEAALRAGLRFAYHNHDFEFEPVNGRLPFDVLLDQTDPDLVWFEMDLFWISRPGHDPLAYFDRHPGRFPLVHVKDMDGSAERRMVDPGEGIIDFPAIVAARERAGIRHWFVEHDQPESPFATARRGLEYLRRLRTAA